MIAEQTQGRPQFEIPTGVKVDWTDTNGEIAKQLGCSPLTVMRLRVRLGKKPLKQGRPFEKVELTTSTIKEYEANIKLLKQTVANLTEIFEARRG